MKLKVFSFLVFAACAGNAATGQHVLLKGKQNQTLVYADGQLHKDSNLGDFMHIGMSFEDAKMFMKMPAPGRLNYLGNGASKFQKYYSPSAPQLIAAAQPLAPRPAAQAPASVPVQQRQTAPAPVHHQAAPMLGQQPATPWPAAQAPAPQYQAPQWQQPATPRPAAQAPASVPVQQRQTAPAPVHHQAAPMLGQQPSAPTSSPYGQHQAQWQYPATPGLATQAPASVPVQQWQTAPAPVHHQAAPMLGQQPSAPWPATQAPAPQYQAPQWQQAPAPYGQYFPVPDEYNLKRLPEMVGGALSMTCNQLCTAVMGLNSFSDTRSIPLLLYPNVWGAAPEVQKLTAYERVNLSSVYEQLEAGANRYGRPSGSPPGLGWVDLAKAIYQACIMRSSGTIRWDDSKWADFIKSLANSAISRRVALLGQFIDNPSGVDLPRLQSEIRTAIDTAGTIDELR